MVRTHLSRWCVGCGWAWIAHSTAREGKKFDVFVCFMCDTLLSGVAIWPFKCIDDFDGNRQQNAIHCCVSVYNNFLLRHEMVEPPRNVGGLGIFGVRYGQILVNYCPLRGLRGTQCIIKKKLGTGAVWVVAPMGRKHHVLHGRSRFPMVVGNSGG